MLVRNAFFVVFFDELTFFKEICFFLSFFSGNLALFFLKAKILKSFFS